MSIRIAKGWVLAMCLFLGATAWGGGAPVQAENVTLTVQTWMGGTAGDFFENEIFPEFEQKYGVEVVHIEAFGANYWDRLTSMTAAGQGPDVFFTTAFDLPGLVEGGLARSIQGLADRDKVDLSDFFPTAVEQYRLDGGLYAIPWDFGYRVLAYNRSLFDEHGLAEPPADWDDPGWTFADSAEAAKRLTLVDGEGKLLRVGLGFPHKGSIDNVARGLTPWLYSNGARLLVESNGSLATGLTDSRALDVLRFLQEQVVTRTMGPGWQAQFINGQTAMQQTIPGTVALLQDSITEFDWDIAPWPAGEAGRGTSGGGSGWVLAQTSKHQELAWELIKFVTSRDVQLRHMQTGAKAVARFSLARTSEWRGDAPPSRMDVFAQAPEYVVYEPPTTAWSSYAQLVLDQLRDVWTGNRSPEQASAEIERLASPILNGD